MPSHKSHRFVNRLILGRNYQNVNDFCDAKWALRMYGPNHRVVNHDVLSLVKQYGFTDNTLAGLVHIGTDKAVSAYKKELRRVLGHDGYSAWKATWEAINHAKK